MIQLGHVYVNPYSGFSANFTIALTPLQLLPRDCHETLIHGICNSFSKTTCLIERTATISRRLILTRSLQNAKRPDHYTEDSAISSPKIFNMLGVVFNVGEVGFVFQKTRRYDLNYTHKFVYIYFHHYQLTSTNYNYTIVHLVILSPKIILVLKTTFSPLTQSLHQLNTAQSFQSVHRFRIINYKRH